MRIKLETTPEYLTKNGVRTFYKVSSRKITTPEVDRRRQVVGGSSKRRRLDPEVVETGRVLDEYMLFEAVKKDIARIVRRELDLRPNRKLVGRLHVSTPSWKNKGLWTKDLLKLKLARVLELFTLLQQSAEVINFEELTFTFYPQSQMGRAFPKPHFIPNNGKIISLDQWDFHSDARGPINCVAYAIAAFQGRDNRKNRAREIMDEVGWGETITDEELGQFVTKYPQYRLTLMEGVGADTCEKLVFVGDRYVIGDIRDPKRRPPNAIYLFRYYDPDYDHAHVVSSKFPKMVIYFPQARDCSGRLFCHQCMKTFAKASGHSHENIQFSAHMNPRCDQCFRYHPNKRDCLLRDCHHCKVKYMPGEHEHCLLLADDRDPKMFSTDGQKGDGKKRALLVWDIESEFAKIEMNRVKNTERL